VSVGLKYTFVSSLWVSSKLSPLKIGAHEFRKVKKKLRPERNATRWILPGSLCLWLWQCCCLLESQCSTQCLVSSTCSLPCGLLGKGPTTGALFRGLPILLRFLRGCCVGDGDGVGAGAGVVSGRDCSEDGGGDGDGSGRGGVASKRDGATSLRDEKRFAVVTGVK
jgi:hypothetical protein